MSKEITRIVLSDTASKVYCVPLDVGARLQHLPIQKENVARPSTAAKIRFQPSATNDSAFRLYSALCPQNCASLCMGHANMQGLSLFDELPLAPRATTEGPRRPRERSMTPSRCIHSVDAPASPRLLRGAFANSSNNDKPPNMKVDS